MFMCDEFIRSTSMGWTGSNRTRNSNWNRMSSISFLPAHCPIVSPKSIRIFLFVHIYNLSVHFLFLFSIQCEWTKYYSVIILVIERRNIHSKWQQSAIFIFLLLERIFYSHKNQRMFSLFIFLRIIHLFFFSPFYVTCTSKQKYMRDLFYTIRRKRISSHWEWQ